MKKSGELNAVFENLLKQEASEIILFGYIYISSPEKNSGPKLETVGDILYMTGVS